MSNSTRAIELLTLTPDLVAQAGDAELLGRAHDIVLGDVASLVQRTVEQNEAFRQRIGAPAAWCGHLAIDAASRQVIGTCAFKGEPEDGTVEIAYFTFPPFEGRGYGRAMCRALVQKAAVSGVVRVVSALTLPENNASTRILAHSGFSLLGPVAHPDDGTVFQWQLLLPIAAS